jgi:hypothetical protein
VRMVRRDAADSLSSLQRAAGMMSTRNMENANPEEKNDCCLLELDSKVVDEWTQATSFPKVKCLHDDKDLARGGPSCKFFKSCANTNMEGPSGETATSSGRSQVTQECLRRPPMEIMWTKNPEEPQCQTIGGDKSNGTKAHG